MKIKIYKDNKNIKNNNKIFLSFRIPQETASPQITNFFPQHENQRSQSRSEIKEETPPSSAHRNSPHFQQRSQNAPNPFSGGNLSYGRSQSMTQPSAFNPNNPGSLQAIGQNQDQSNLQRLEAGLGPNRPPHAASMINLGDKDKNHLIGHSSQTSQKFNMSHSQSQNQQYQNVMGYNQNPKLNPNNSHMGALQHNQNTSHHRNNAPQGSNMMAAQLQMMAQNNPELFMQQLQALGIPIQNLKQFGSQPSPQIQHQTVTNQSKSNEII